VRLGNASLGADRTASPHSNKGHPIFTAKVLIAQDSQDRKTAWAFHKHMFSEPSNSRLSVLKTQWFPRWPSRQVFGTA
jgi:hypothetical protein